MSGSVAGWPGTRESELESEFESEFENENEAEGEGFGFGDIVSGLLGEGVIPPENKGIDK